MTELFEPPLCRCGHYAYIHWPSGRCPGWSRHSFRLGPLSLMWRCRCRTPRTASTPPVQG